MGSVLTVAAYILLQTDVGKSSSVCKAVGMLSGVVSCEEVTGPYDLIVKAEAESLDELGFAHAKLGNGRCNIYFWVGSKRFCG